MTRRRAPFEPLVFGVTPATNEDGYKVPPGGTFEENWKAADAIARSAKGTKAARKFVHDKAALTEPKKRRARKAAP